MDAVDGITIGNNCQVLNPKYDAGVTVQSKPSAVFMEGFSNTTSSFNALQQYVSNATAWPQRPLVQAHLGSKDCWNLIQGKPTYGCNNTLAAIMVLMHKNVYIGLGACQY